MSKLDLTPDVALNKSSRLMALADDMSKNLASAQETMEYVNSIFTGSDSAITAQQAFEEIINDFPSFYKQVEKFAYDVKVTAEKMKNS